MVSKIYRGNNHPPNLCCWGAAGCLVFLFESHWPLKGLFTTLPLTYVHIHIPHYWMSEGSFSKLNSVGPLLALFFSLFHCTDYPALFKLFHSIPPNHFSINMNQNQSPWRWRQYIPLKYRDTHLLHGTETQKKTINWKARYVWFLFLRQITSWVPNCNSTKYTQVQLQHMFHNYSKTIYKEFCSNILALPGQKVMEKDDDG
jgi:hypothetical protein